MPATKEDVKEFLKSMPVHELLGFVKELEEEWGVTAAAPVAAGAMGAPGAGAESKTDEGPSEVSVVITSHGDKKIQVIKTVREITGLGLKEAKDLVDNSPKPIKENIEKEEAEKIKAQLEEAGAVVELK